MSEAIQIFLIIFVCLVIAGIHVWEEKHIYDVKMYQHSTQVGRKVVH